MVVVEMQLLKQTVPISKFTPHVVVATYDQNGDNPIPENVAESFIRNSAISFAEKTGILTEKININLQCGLSEYPIEASDCNTVIGVKSAKMGDWASEDCGCSWNWGEVQFQMIDDLLKIYPAPNDDIENGLQLEVVVIPNRDACELDAQLYDKWFDAIVNGALAELHMLPSRHFSSTTRGDYRKRMFNEDVGRATMRRVLEGNRKPLRMSPNPDWGRYGSARRRF